MHDARDAEDARLLEERDYATLFAKYEPIIVGRCIVALKGHADAEDVAQNVMLRLFGELHRGRTYSVPFRVVVHQVIKWTLNDYWAGLRLDVPLPEDWDPAAPNEADAVESRWFLETVFDGLPDRQREAAELRYLEGLERDQIAERLGIRENAVDQALHNAHAKLREVLAGG